MNTEDVCQYLIEYNKWRRYDGDMDKSPKQPDPKTLGQVIDAAIKMIHPASHEFSVGTKFTRRTGKIKRVETIVDFNTTRNLEGEIISSEYICSQTNHENKLLFDSAKHSTLKLATIIET